MVERDRRSRPENMESPLIPIFFSRVLDYLEHEGETCVDARAAVISALPRAKNVTFHHFLT